MQFDCSETSEGRADHTKFYEVQPGYAGEITPSASRQQRFQSHLQVETFDVGTGQASLVTAPNGRTMLVDAGSDNRSTSIANALARQIPNGSLRAILLTHPHKDHGGAIGQLVSDHEEVLADQVTLYESGVPGWNHKTDQPRVWWRDLATRLENSTRATRVSVTGLIRPNPLGASVGLTLYADSYPQDPDYQSVLMHVTFREARILFAGDANCDYEIQLLNRYHGDDVFPAHALNVTHHGNENGTSRRFAAAVSPGIAFASTFRSSGHHWEDVARARLPRECLEIETWKCGDVVIRTDGRRIRQGVLFQVETRRPGAMAAVLNLPTQRLGYTSTGKTDSDQRAPCDESPPC